MLSLFFLLLLTIVMSFSRPDTLSLSVRLDQLFPCVYVRRQEGVPLRSATLRIYVDLFFFFAFKLTLDLDAISAYPFAALPPTTYGIFYFANSPPLPRAFLSSHAASPLTAVQPPFANTLPVVPEFVSMASTCVDVYPATPACVRS